MTPLLASAGLADWSAVRNVLVVRLDNLGDVLMTTPALSALRERSPDMRLTLLASPAGASALRHLSMLEAAIVYEAPWMKGRGASAESLAQDRALVDRLAAEHFDAAVIFTVATQSALPAALMCRLAGIPLRLAHCRENPYDLLTHWIAEPDAVADGMRHEVARQLDLVASVGFRAPSTRLHFHFGLGDALGMFDKLAQAGGSQESPYVVVHPGATAPSRRYPAVRFGTAAAAIAAQSGRQIVWCGSTDEAGLIAEAQAAMPHPGISLAGQLSIGELGALIAGAEVLVCNNSAPAHLAAAVATPVVVLYALTNPQHTPWQVDSDVLNHPVSCRNCLKSVCPQLHHLCLLGVPADAVAAAALRLMRHGARRPPPVAGRMVASTLSFEKVLSA